MSEFLAVSPRLKGEAESVEGRLADILETAEEVVVDDYKVSRSDLDKIVYALRHAAPPR